MNPVAGMSAFLIFFTIIQFSISNYDNRVDTKVETILSELKYGSLETGVKITNTGGKTIYLNVAGIITDDGVFIDFEDDPDKNDPMYMHVNNPKLPAILNPGDAKSLWMDNTTILRLLCMKKYSIKNEFKFKGVFIDKMKNEYYEPKFNSHKSEDFFKIKK